MPDTIQIDVRVTIDRAPVTAEQWRAVMGAPPPREWRGYVTGVTHTEAAEYALKVGGRLPTEQEWLAALGDDTFIFPGLWEWTAIPGPRGTYRLRGGSLEACAIHPRAVARDDLAPGNRHNYSGFRCARESPAQATVVPGLTQWQQVSEPATPVKTAGERIAREWYHTNDLARRIDEAIAEAVAATEGRHDVDD